MPIHRTVPALALALALGACNSQRDRDVAACRDRLTRVGAVVLVGPSGSGKSSLVRAGLTRVISTARLGADARGLSPHRVGR